MSSFEIYFVILSCLDMYTTEDNVCCIFFLILNAAHNQSQGVLKYHSLDSQTAWGNVP